ncbi:f-box domain containing protein [Ophiostoma piceae UAMH 11346]|uniref:F-box domain containing protein n=1 Tax=Ophiostoma piceae (strain UAMH 11346) TaxID=1262450 RepID=S3CRH6_OPHP1|nr:f-box domain containing protein [Ophiostoma piceae UAMH 11346]
MVNISAMGIPDSSSKPLDTSFVPQHSSHDEASTSSGYPAGSRKRKSNEASRGLDSKPTVVPRSNGGNGPQKKRRLGTQHGALTPTQVFRIPKDKSRLPREIWNHIFLFLPPRALGNLLRVNKLFNTYLDPSSRFTTVEQLPPLVQSVAKAMDPNNIWRWSRRAFWRKTPGPFKDMTELDMWRIACSSTCQFCGREDSRQQLPPSDPYRYGPGANGVARIWEFRVRSCGSCFNKKTVKEMDLIMSTASTFLLPALQFVFATSNSTIIPLHVIESGKLPPTESLSKLFWSPDVESLREEFLSVKELGPAAADEWQKGLSTRGSKQRAEVAKWQKYDESGGVSNMRTRLHHKHKETKAAPQVQVALLPVDSLTQTVESEAPKAVDTLQPLSVEGKSDADLPAPDGGKTKEEIDAEWDEIQGPVRLNILKYADEAIAGDWDDGEKVTKDNAPSFAADVLLHVRNRFYSEVEKEAKVARAAGQQPVIDPPEGPFTQKLSLENIKYVFDVKVKPITGSLRKELFLCNDCDYNGKFFGFEGVIQHFAAKHTTALSVGNIVVHWRAEWPAHPPFKANPRPPKTNTQLTLPAKPPSSRSAKISSTRHSHGFNPASHGSSPGHLHELENIPPAQPVQHLPLHSGPGLGSGIAAVPYDGPQYIPGPPHVPQSSVVHFPQTGAYFLGGQQGHSQFPQSQPGLPPYAGPEAHQEYFEMSHRYGGLNPADPSAFPGAYNMNLVGSHTAAPDQSAVDSAGYSTARIHPTPGAPAEPSSTHGAETEAKLNEIAIQSDALWRATESMQRLPAAVRRHTVHFHLNILYKKRFNESVPIRLFTEALMTREEMRPLRTGNLRLPCKACQLSLGGEWGDNIRRDAHLISDLVKHFAETHVSYEQNGELQRSSRDWLTDMLLLPTRKALSFMAGKRGKKFPLLFVALQGIPPRETVGGAATKKIKYKDRGKEFSPQMGKEQMGIRGRHVEEDTRHGAEVPRHAQVVHEPWKADLDRTRNDIQSAAAETRRHNYEPQQREPSVVIKREESQGPVFSGADQAPKRPNPAIVAAAEANDKDILGALEKHLDHRPAQHSTTTRDDHLRQVHREPRESGYERHIEGHPRDRVVSFDHRYQVRETEARTKPQADRMALDVATRNEARTPYNAPYQPRATMPARPSIGELAPSHAARRDEYGIVYDYDRRGQQSQPPPLPHPQHYARGPVRHEYQNRYAEQETPAGVEYEPYEAYEVVRVVHPEGDYLARRPVRREVVELTESQPSRQYYRQPAPLMYEETERRPVGRQGYEQEYYAGPASYVGARPPQAPEVYETLPYNRSERPRERTIATASALRSSAPHNGTYYEEYDPRYPATTAGQSQPQPTPRDERGHQQRYQ